MISPGSTIGIIGGGQLGRMTVLAGRRMGYRFHIYEPSSGNCAGMVADREINAPYQDEAAVEAFAEEIDVATFEFENIPAETLQTLEWRVPVRPGSHALTICQNRGREKAFLKEHGFPCAPFVMVSSLDELKAGVASLGMPCVLKTADFGYDGKGQHKINSEEDIDKAWAALDEPLAVLEQWMTFRGEYSIICARNKRGDVKLFPMAENIHENHILDICIVPARVEAEKVKEAEAMATRIATELGIIGLLAVEFFLTESGEWIVNELAPRPHNSGHYTFDACVTNQFEQQIRAVCDLPLGSPDLLKPVVMVNMLGDLWSEHEPRWEAILSHPQAKLHLYDKGAPRPGRKMGHYCVFDDDINTALAEAMQIRSVLGT